MSTENPLHLVDHELLRLVDGDADALQRARWEKHLAACTRCTDAADSLRGDAALFSTTLAAAAYEADLPPRPAFAALRARGRPQQATRRVWRTTPGWLRAAAVLVLLAAPVAAIPSLRDWLARTLRPDATERAVAPAIQAAPEPGSGSVVRFVPAVSEFVVQLDVAQAAGTLRISAAAGEEALLTMAGNRGELPVYSGTTLRIRNSAASAASYELQLPPSVQSVTVRVGEQTVGRLDSSGIRAGASLGLRQ